MLCGSQPGQIMDPMTNASVEIDECILMPTMCNHGSCLNTPGSFECQCNRGFVYDVVSHQCIGEESPMRLLHLYDKRITEIFQFNIQFIIC